MIRVLAFSLLFSIGAGWFSKVPADVHSTDSLMTGSAAVPDTLGSVERAALLYSRPGTEPASEGMTPSIRFIHPGPALGEVRGPVRLNTFQRTVYAADRGAHTGLLIGTLGSVMGWWDEETAWYLMGAGAALGVVQGAVEEATR